MRFFEVLDMEVNVHLLRRPIGPVRGDVIWRELDADAPLSTRVDDAVKRFVLEDVAAQKPGPKRALGVQFGGVKHHDAAY